MHEVIFPRRVRKLMSRFPRRDYERVLEAVRNLAEDPKPHGSRKMRGVGSREEWRIRVGDYRVVYRIDDTGEEESEEIEVRITILAAGHRGSVYDQ